MTTARLSIHDPAPDFRLPDVVSGAEVALADLAGRGVLVAFICNHCPFVLHVIDQFTPLATELATHGIVTVAISANDVAAFPEDGPREMADCAREHGFGFPYLYDQDQSVARAYDAVCTPDFFLFDGKRRLVYHGQFDASRPTTEHRQGNTLPVTGDSLRAACEALLAGRPPLDDQRASIGCSIKWKPAPGLAA